MPHPVPILDITPAVVATLGLTACDVLEEVPTLSVRQPWADLIVLGLKPLENRPRGTSYRGPLAIHAGLTLDRQAEELARTTAIAAGVPRATIDRVIVEARTRRGVVVGLVVLHDVTEGTRSPWAHPGSKHWRFARGRAHRFATGIPAKGRLSFFPSRLRLERAPA